MRPAPFTDIHPRITDWINLANVDPEPGKHLMEHLARVHSDFERITPSAMAMAARAGSR